MHTKHKAIHKQAHHTHWTQTVDCTQTRRNTGHIQLYTNIKYTHMQSTRIWVEMPICTILFLCLHINTHTHTSLILNINLLSLVLSVFLLFILYHALIDTDMDGFWHWIVHVFQSLYRIIHQQIVLPWRKEKHPCLTLHHQINAHKNNTNKKQYLFHLWEGILFFCQTNYLCTYIQIFVYLTCGIKRHTESHFGLHQAI